MLFVLPNFACETWLQILVIKLGLFAANFVVYVKSAGPKVPIEVVDLAMASLLTIFQHAEKIKDRITSIGESRHQY